MLEMTQRYHSLQSALCIYYLKFSLPKLLSVYKCKNNGRQVSCHLTSFTVLIYDLLIKQLITQVWLSENKQQRFFYGTPKIEKSKKKD